MGICYYIMTVIQHAISTLQRMRETPYPRQSTMYSGAQQRSRWLEYTGATSTVHDTMLRVFQMTFTPTIKRIARHGVRISLTAPEFWASMMAFRSRSCSSFSALERGSLRGGVQPFRASECHIDIRTCISLEEG